MLGGGSAICSTLTLTLTNPNPTLTLTLTLTLALTLTPTLRRELRDLLNPKSKEKLKIRNGKQGTYVQGVKKMAVASYDEIEKVRL